MPTMTMSRLPLIGRARTESASPAAAAPEALKDVGVSATEALAPSEARQRQTRRMRRAVIIAAASLVVSAAAIIAAQMLAQRYVKTNGPDR